MYDRVELRAETDKYWSAIATRLAQDGIAAPAELTRDADRWELWSAPDLLLAQTCGLPFRARLHRDVALVGTPDYGLPGCAPGHYCSVMVVRAGTSGDLDALSRARFAYNDPLSQSGWAAPVDWAGQLGLRFGPLIETGAHIASARAVADGRADLAGIDAVTWRLIKRYDAFVSELREIAMTRPTPGLPYIAAGGRNTAPIADAVSAAIKDLSLADRSALGLTGLVHIPREAYLAQGTPPSPDVYAETLGA